MKKNEISSSFSHQNCLTSSLNNTSEEEMQMARKRIGMKKIREIIRFKETTNMSERKIARAINISRPVVAQYIRDFNASGLTYEDTKDMPDSRLLTLLEKQKKTKCLQYEELSQQFPYITTELQKTGVTLMILWNEYLREHPDSYPSRTGSPSKRQGTG
jgi:predicted transcriptional regulator